MSVANKPLSKKPFDANILGTNGLGKIIKITKDYHTLYRIHEAIPFEYNANFTEHETHVQMLLHVQSFHLKYG